MSDSRYTVYDVLPSFFANDDPWLALGQFEHDHLLHQLLTLYLADFEAYVRCGYRMYSLLSIDYEGDGGDDGVDPTILTWRFTIGKSHSPPQTPRMGSFGFVASFKD